MAINSIGTTLVFAGLCLLFTLAIDASQNSGRGCSGPTNYYKELGCTPVFKNPNDRCPIRYNCSALEKLRSDQCLVNGHVYEIGEDIRKEDANPCDWCTCVPHYTGGFSCALPSCAEPDLPNETCHFIDTNDCCGSQIVCPKPDGSYANCTVDGKTYRDGEEFVPSAEPHKRCRCAEGYTGKNIEPYCISPKHTWCNNVIESQIEIRFCAPVYREGTSLEHGCNEGFRCPTGYDVVIKPKKDETPKPEDPDNLCEFGYLTLRKGDQLNEDPSEKVKCVCEVPPILTCRQTIAN